MSLRVIIAIAALSGVLIAVPAQADTKDDLDAARDELASKQAELDALTLQWQQTETAYALAQEAVRDAQEQIGTLQAQLVKIQRQFDKQVRTVYISGGSERDRSPARVGVVLGLRRPAAVRTGHRAGRRGRRHVGGGPVGAAASRARAPDRTGRRAGEGCRGAASTADGAGCAARRPAVDRERAVPAVPGRTGPGADRPAEPGRWRRVVPGDGLGRHLHVPGRGAGVVRGLVRVAAAGRTRIRAST